MNEFNLTFSKALELTMGGMYIRSNIMQDGIFLRLDEMGSLYICDGFDMYKKLDNFTITTNSYNAKWRAFNVANKKALTL